MLKRLPTWTICLLLPPIALWIWVDTWMKLRAMGCGWDALDEGPGSL